MTTTTSNTIIEPKRPSRFGALLANPASSNLTILALLVVIFVIFSVVTPAGTFLSQGNLQSIALQGSTLLIIAAGVTFLLIAAGIDLSVGAVVAFSAVAAATVMRDMTVGLDPDERFGLAIWGPVVIGILAALISGAAWGFINGLIVVKTRVPPFIATLATSTIILGAAQIWTGGLNVSGAPGELQKAFGLGTLFGIIPYPVILAAVVVAILWVIMAKTKFGMRNYAVGANPESARRAGINVDRHLLIVYGLVGLLAGLIGVIDVARYTTATVTGYTGLALQAITAAVIGGTSLWGGRGRMSGTIVGAFIPATLTSGFVVMGIQPFWQNVAIGIVLLLAVFIDQYRRRAVTLR